VADALFSAMEISHNDADVEAGADVCSVSIATSADSRELEVSSSFSLPLERPEKR